MGKESFDLKTAVEQINGREADFESVKNGRFWGIADQMKPFGSSSFLNTFILNSSIGWLIGNSTH